jgi:DNA (cytosine-5)-methyltransferase 1
MLVAPPFLIDSGGVWESGALNMLGAPYPTQSTRRQPGMVLPFVVEVGHGGPENNARVRSAADALPTQHTLGGSGVVFAPLIVPLDHQQGEKPARSGYEPMPTQTTRQEIGYALAPFLAELHGTSGTRGIDEALSCVTAGGNHHGLVASPPFWLSYYGEGENVHAIEEALATQTTRDRHALVRPTGELPAVEDCGFRVLKPHEIQRAMAFADDYVVLGTARDRVKQLGNAVTPPAARWLIQQCRHVLER